jgi:hypothetical protein
MRAWVLAAWLLSGCAEDDLLTRPGTRPGVAFTTVEPAASCRSIETVEVRAGHHDPTSHEMLSQVAVERGANYVVLESYGVMASDSDIYAVTRARLYQCPIPMVCYRSSR